MGDSSPDIQAETTEHELLDAAEDLLDAVPEFDETSEISSVVKTSHQVSRASFTLSRPDDEEAPDVTCTFGEESDAFDGLVARESRSEGHGSRPVVAAGTFPVSGGPKVLIEPAD